jgi:phosphomannomutase/phosphoglucomutase
LPATYTAFTSLPRASHFAKTKVIESITAHFAQSYPVNTLDGARIDFGEGAWAGIRQSNTSPCLSICMEARSEGKLKEMEGVVLEHLKGYSEVTM